MLQDSRDASAELKGVAVACFLNDWGGFHVGFLYKQEDDSTWLCHVAWDLVCENLRVDKQDWCWTNINRRSEILEILAGVLELAGHNDGKIPYDVTFSETEEYFDPLTWSFKREMPGLTCATYIMAILRNLRLELFDVPTWPSRPEDGPAIERLISELEKRGAEQQRIARMRLNHNNVRFRPEEVCGSVSESSWPVAFEAAESHGMAVAQKISARGMPKTLI